MAGTKKKPSKKTLKPGKDIIEPVVEDIKKKLLKTINPDIKELAIDMKNVKEFDSTGLGVLIAAKNSIEQSGGQLNLKNVPKDIGSFLQILGLDGYFNLNAE